MSTTTIDAGPTTQTRRTTVRDGLEVLGVLAPAALALGMSSNEFRAALQSGNSLSTLAVTRGVSAETMRTAIHDSLTRANPALSVERALAVAQRLLEGPRTSVAI